MFFQYVASLSSEWRGWSLGHVDAHTDTSNITEKIDISRINKHRWTAVHINILCSVVHRLTNMCNIQKTHFYVHTVTGISRHTKTPTHTYSSSYCSPMEWPYPLTALQWEKCLELERLGGEDRLTDRGNREQVIVGKGGRKKVIQSRYISALVWMCVCVWIGVLVQQTELFGLLVCYELSVRYFAAHFWDLHRGIKPSVTSRPLMHKYTHTQSSTHKILFMVVRVIHTGI